MKCYKVYYMVEFNLICSAKYLMQELVFWDLIHLYRMWSLHPPPLTRNFILKIKSIYNSSHPAVIQRPKSRRFSIINNPSAYLTNG